MEQSETAWYDLGNIREFKVGRQELNGIPKAAEDVELYRYLFNFCVKIRLPLRLYRCVFEAQLSIS